MATASKFANANAVVTTGWTNPTNAYADDTAFATAVPAKNTTINSDYKFANFSTGDIPDGSTINSVTMAARFKNSTTTTNKTHGVQGRNNGANSGTEATATGNTAEGTVTATLGTVTLSDLRSASTLLFARVRASQGNSSTTSTSSLDWVQITVDYTAEASNRNGTLDGSGITAPTNGAVAGLLAKTGNADGSGITAPSNGAVAGITGRVGAPSGSGIAAPASGAITGFQTGGGTDYISTVFGDNPTAYWTMGEGAWTPTFACGFEDAAITTHWSVSGSGTGTESLDTTTFRSGAKSIRFQPTGSTDRYVYKYFASTQSLAVARFSMLFGSLPSPSSDRCTAKINGVTVWNIEVLASPTNHLLIQPNPLGTGSIADVGLIQTGVWYDIDLWVDGTNMVAGARVNGVDYAFNCPSTTETFDGMFFGPMYAGITATNDVYFDDVAYSHTLADYPAHTGYVNTSDAWSTDIFDITGRGHTGTVTGTPTYGVTGPIDGSTAIEIGGTGGNYFTIPDHADLDLGDGPFTIEMWYARTADLGAVFEIVLGKGTNGYNAGIGGSGAVPNDDQWMLGKQGVTILATSLTDPVPTDGSWIYWVITRSGTGTGTNKVYKNGVDDSNYENTTTSLVDTSTPLIIGRESASDYATGRVAHIALYKSVLSPAQISAHWAASGISEIPVGSMQVMLGGGL